MELFYFSRFIPNLKPLPVFDGDTGVKRVFCLCLNVRLKPAVGVGHNHLCLPVLPSAGVLAMPDSLSACRVNCSGFHASASEPLVLGSVWAPLHLAWPGPPPKAARTVGAVLGSSWDVCLQADLC